MSLVMMMMKFLVLLVHPIFIFSVGAQESNPSVQDALRNFEPSLAIVIGILSILFSLTFLLLIYAKFCHGPPAGTAPAGAAGAGGSVHNGSLLEFQAGLIRSRSQSSGVDKTVVESLPLFKFSSLKGSRDGLECAVCLSRFEDPEILRLLPKCKHAFHVGCIDQWLQKHSTCPLCRHKISSDDLASLQYSRSLRFLWSNRQQQPEATRDDEQTTNLEVHIQRLENSRSWSSRFIRKSGIKKLNHRINIVSAEVVFKNRWSNVSSSDLMILTSEMILDSTSSRFSSLGRNSIDRHSSTAARVVAEPDPVFAKKSNDHETCPSSSSSSSSSSNSRIVSKTMSEIVIHPRFRDFSLKNSNGSDLSSENDRNVKEERRRKAWLPIARRTVEWFASRERRQSINV
ncbi:hypothetical protein DM860_004105 [Cuscuta australis]|uniref:RING-type E3 ubiquitin transferase n=1 Tax=Cuscuta australis TaxID=267555 RepID=A0A328CZY3_9ASTE|nr:hypothetical protein DM860_004105 [Cuscuta australis]